MHRKLMTNLMDFDVKIREHREKNGSKNDAFFKYVFLSISDGFGEGFGRVLGGVWRPLGAFWATFYVILWCLNLECAWEGLSEASGLVSGGIWEGLKAALGGVWECFGRDFKGFWVILGCSGLF